MDVCLLVTWLQQSRRCDEIDWQAERGIDGTTNKQRVTAADETPYHKMAVRYAASDYESCRVVHGGAGSLRLHASRYQEDMHQTPFHAFEKLDACSSQAENRAIEEDGRAGDIKSD